MAYGIHHEWRDGSFEDKPFATLTSKRAAISNAKEIAKARAIDPFKEELPTFAIHVCDADGNTIQKFPVGVAMFS